ncbi:MAG: response regulator transcription factor [Planctomyces sp.]|jgi:FixJ family two-component response regulator
MEKESESFSAAEEPTLFLIGLEDRLSQLLLSMKIRVDSFIRPEEFLTAGCMDRPGCIVCEVSLASGVSGFQLLKLLRENRSDLPVILVSGAADMSMALRAVSEGAVTLLSSSCDAQLAWEAVHRGLQQNRCSRMDGAARRRVLSLLASLSERESQILRLISDGLANKQIAAELGVSLRSVEKWRKDGLEKLGIESPLQLLKILMQAGFRGWPRELSEETSPSLRS